MGSDDPRLSTNMTDMAENRTWGKLQFVYVNFHNIWNILNRYPNIDKGEIRRISIVHSEIRFRDKTH